MKTFLKKYIGNKQFYRTVLLIAVPIMVQNGITNLVNLLDNIMVGQIGTNQMSGVAIANQLFFVYNLCIFGGMSGPGIFGAQFYGQRNEKGIRHVFRFKLYAGVVLTAIAILLFLTFGESMITLYLDEGNSIAANKETLKYAMKYLRIMLIGTVPFTVVQMYASTLRETSEAVLPMRAGIVAVFVNLILNYLLILGKFGLPCLGVEGAAIATVISRFVEATIVVAWTHRHKKRNAYIIGVYKRLYIPKDLVIRILKKGTPLLMNEALWSLGMAMLLQCYSVRGLEVVAGMNISNTILNLFNIVFLALGNSVAIIVGKLLGAGQMEEAKDVDRKLIAFSVISCIGIALVAIICAPLFPKLYNTENIVKEYAKIFIIIAAAFMPQHAFLHAAYFTLRSGGKTFTAFLFDSGFMWIVSIPLAFFLSRFTVLPIEPIYIICQAIEFVKCIFGFILLKKGIWVNNIVGETAEA
ncbi:MAG: MATE family efflux transporter [Lachnospiraceae bacterium]|nr:MATE family efflux transporter [Lachnospiraceae bacterium]